jgi:hypothetical protein
MKAPIGFINDLKAIDPHLVVVWNSELERFQILWLDPVLKKPRIVRTLENDDGTFQPCDQRALIYCSQNVCWNTLYKYPTSDQLWGYFKAKWDLEKKKDREYKNDYRRWWNKEHRKEWKEALENAKKGIFSMPDQQPERKIISIGS